MPASGRRVQKLRISGKDEKSITSQVNALADAFRTASLPGLPPHGLILIRQLDLGLLHSAAAPMTLSLLIDKKMQNLASLAVCADKGDYPAANVVWFSDVIQAVSSFLILLSENKTPKAWYWNTLLPAWHPAMDLPQSLACLMQVNAAGVSPLTVGKGIVQQLLNDGKSEMIFKLLTVPLAIQLLNEIQVFPHQPRNKRAEQPSPASIQPVTSSWKKLIAQAISSYGESDPRTLWLSCCALLSHNPCLEDSDGIVHSVTSLIEQCSPVATVDRKTEPARIKDESNTPDSCFIEQNLEENLRQRDFPEKNKSVKLNARGNQFASMEKGDLTVRGEIEAYELFRQHDKRQNVENSSECSESRQTTLPEERVVEANRHKPSDAEIMPSTFVTGRHEPEGRETNFNSAGHGFTFSAYSGLGFVIPLLEYISIRELLQLNPWLAEINFPGRVIRSVAARLGIGQQDPVLQLATELPGIADPRMHHFISPDSWESLLDWPEDYNKTICRYRLAAENQTCYLTDRGRKFLLYVGDEDKNSYPQWLQESPVIEQQGVYSAPTLADLEATTQWLFGKYIRRYARTGLKALMKRPGQVAMTKTHLDILFDISTLDSRVRITGLDIDPGWVSWLGRVVQFHYDYDGQTHV